MQTINLIFTADFVPTQSAAGNAPREIRADSVTAFARAMREASESAKAPDPPRGAREPAPEARADAPETEREEPQSPDVPAALAAVFAAPPPSPESCEPDAEAAEQNDVSILGGQTTDWSLLGQAEKAEALPVAPLDTARMPENPAADTLPETVARQVPLGETDPCPPENVNVKTALGEAPARVREINAGNPSADTAKTPAEETRAKAVPDAPIPGVREIDPAEKKPASGEGEAPESDGGGEDGAAPETRAPELAPERIISDGALRAVSEAVPDAPVTRGELIPAMVERLELMVSDGQKSMSLELKPEFLGRVTMTLVSGAGGVAVKILADDPDVRSAINGEIAGIIERMGERGIRVSSVELSEMSSGGAELSAYASAGEAYSGGQSGASGRSPAPRASAEPSASIAEARTIGADAPAGTYPPRILGADARDAGYGGFDWYGGEDDGAYYERVEYSA
ncbi:MAG: flagellar hook-length control protein FliK [Oscillospiraceae bacterium]|jgi:hypothetical protein|nr:flagellar hook-length control protein FliK [Oscillospiraceae bacterium]